MVNPASEKPKFGRGVPMKELNGVGDRKVDKCLSPGNRNRTWLIYIYCYNEVLYEGIR